MYLKQRINMKFEIENTVSSAKTHEGKENGKENPAHSSCQRNKHNQTQK